MFDPTTSPDSHSAISSQASGGGPSPCSSPDGPPIAPSGPGRAPANPIAPPASSSATPMNEISGPHSSISSASAALTQYLASRLQARLATVGSMEYQQTWKQKTTPAGRSYWAHTASARPISDSDCFGWPTAAARDWKDSAGMATTSTNPDGSTRTRLDQLARVAAIAGYVTPQAFDATNDGEPRALRYKGRAPSEAGNLRDPSRPGSWRGELKDWAANFGVTGCGFPAPTEKRGALNPALARWLMGYPPGWCDCAVTATQSSRK